MSDLDLIETVTIEYRSTGANDRAAEAGRVGASVDKVTRANDDLAASEDRVAVAGNRTTQYRNSAVTAAERLQRTLDAEYKAQKQMEAALRDIERARQQGLISMSREGELIGLAEQRYSSAADAIKRAAAANTNHAQTSGIAAHQLQNLGYQINDVVTSLASGAPAFSTTRPRGTWPFSASAAPPTAHSAT